MVDLVRVLRSANLLLVGGNTQAQQVSEMPRSRKVPVEEVISSASSETASSADESDDARSSVTETSGSDTDLEAMAERKHHRPKLVRSTQHSKDKSKRSKSESESRKVAKTSKRSKAGKAEKPRAKHTKTATSRTKAEVTESESEEDTEDDDGGDATTELIAQYRAKVRKYIKNDNMFGFVKVLTESPLATVLENMHYLFVAASHNDDMISELIRVNKDFNIVSKKFIKSVRESEDCRHKYVESERVAESIANNTPLKQIPSISEYTPEFIVMKTVQSGDLVTCNFMLKKWDIAPMFAASKVLVAALYGWEDFFGNTERFSKSQDLVVHALCGGYKRVLSVVCSGSGSKWVSPETLQKAGLVLPVRDDIKKKFKHLINERL